MPPKKEIFYFLSAVILDKDFCTRDGIENPSYALTLTKTLQDMPTVKEIKITEKTYQPDGPLLKERNITLKQLEKIVLTKTP